ncbi:MAG TPA: phosphate acetyltransferase [Thermoleophilaceae bacterium]|nr:phosphate acetyltransferase [Thermoleophilaceae bacterium]
MAQSVYITAMAAQSGKSVVALGLMEMLASRAERVGFFRPIVFSDGEADPEIELMRRRYGLDAPVEQMFAMSDGEAQAAIAEGRRDEVKKRVVAAYRELAADRDAMVCEGTDFAGHTPALDFDLNAELANELGVPVLVVVSGRTPEEAVEAARVAQESLREKGCELFGVVVNRVPVTVLREVTTALAGQDGDRPVYVLPEQPELAHPTVAEVASTLGAQPLFELGDLRNASWAGASLAMPDTSDELLQRDVRGVRIAAMSVEHFIEGLEEGVLVIVPADRPDVLIASITCTLSSAFPSVSAVVLTGDYELNPSIRRLLQVAPFPVLETPASTYEAAARVESVRPAITADNERKIASALGVFEAGVDAHELEQRMAIERPARMTPTMFEYELVERAKADRRHIVLPEGDDERVLIAADILLRRGVVDLTVLGNANDVAGRSAALGLDLDGVNVVDPETSPLRAVYAGAYHEMRKNRGMTEELALETVGDVSYFGTLMVQAGDVDGMVSGAAHTTGDTIRPAFQIIKAQRGVSVVSSVFLMLLPDRVLVYGDCAVNPKPDSRQLADIAISSAETAATFGVEPRVAMLSYSTGESARGPDVDAVRSATEVVQERRPDLKVEGPIQYDAAVDASVAQKKLPGSEVAGQATVFIFPDLDTGNIAYKAVQRSSGATAVGPVLQGLNKPVNDLSRGCTVTDIVNTVVITAIQAQEILGRSTSRLREKLPTA